MPIYEYQCQACTQTHEVMQKFSDPLLEACPSCNGPVTKLMSMTSFALKGSGWYTTDYKKSSSPASSASSSAAKASAESCSGPAPGGACGSGACGSS